MTSETARALPENLPIHGLILLLHHSIEGVEGALFGSSLVEGAQLERA